jgi:hypothetical protein
MPLDRVDAVVDTILASVIALMLLLSLIRRKPSIRC